MVDVPAAGVRARVVHAVGDGGCCPWVLAVFSPSGKRVLLLHGSRRERCHHVVVLSGSPHVLMRTTCCILQAGGVVVKVPS